MIFIRFTVSSVDDVHAQRILWKWCVGVAVLAGQWCQPLGKADALKHNGQCCTRRCNHQPGRFQTERRDVAFQNKPMYRAPHALNATFLLATYYVCMYVKQRRTRAMWFSIAGKSFVIRPVSTHWTLQH